ncbi:hypothetical protein K439DRAFT_1628083 [Ramaria rubella]|nr:hypothetical protein K439DRAFT_1628083 [Ramaria rubella]
MLPNFVTSVAPIWRLPQEILGEVFYHTIPKISFEEIQECDSPVLDPRVHPAKTRSTIQLVCHHWYTVLCKTPKLWATIVLETMQIDIEVVERVFNLSKACLLDVYIDSKDASKLFSRIFQTHASRFRLLYVVHGHEATGEIYLLFLAELYLRVQELRFAQHLFDRLYAPSLEWAALDLIFVGRMDRDTILNVLLDLKCPKLRRLAIRNAWFGHSDKVGDLLIHFPSLNALCLEKCIVGPTFFSSISQDDIVAQKSHSLETLHIFDTQYSVSNLSDFVRSHSIEQKTAPGQLKEVLVELKEEQVVKEQRLELGDAYDHVVVITTEDGKCGNPSCPLRICDWY